VVIVSREARWLARELRAAQRPKRPVVLVAAGWLLRHLPEIVAGFIAWRLWSVIASSIGPQWTVVLVVALVAGLLLWQPSRRAVVAVAGCELTRHRLRAALIEVRTTTRAGRLPLFLWLTPTPVGERVWLWCRVGISARDLDDEIDAIRAACAARDVRVTRDRRWAALVTVDVIRRDPLAAASTVTSPLAGRLRRGKAARDG
jgi:hypothetical protein